MEDLLKAARERIAELTKGRVVYVAANIALERKLARALVVVAAASDVRWLGPLTDEDDAAASHLALRDAVDRYMDPGE